MSRPGFWSPSAYRNANMLLTIAMALVLLYPLLFGHWLPIPAALTHYTGAEPPSRGLSRAFALIERGHISEAQAICPHALRIFAFFALQLPMRLIAMHIATHRTPKALVWTDITFSTTMFLFCFAPLIKYTLLIMSRLAIL